MFSHRSDRSGRALLRRYVSGSECSASEIGCHNASVPIGRFPVVHGEQSADGRNNYERSPDPSEYADDTRWPTACPCGYVFMADDEWQVNCQHIYASDTGVETTLRNPPPGAMWDAWWMPWKGPDGKSLMVMTPDGHPWNIDGPASNCDMPDDREHRCWVRHGEPPNIHVDKNGRTCGAGAGSIQTPKWHGFLTNGVLQEQR